MPLAQALPAVVDSAGEETQLATCGFANKHAFHDLFTKQEMIFFVCDLIDIRRLFLSTGMLFDDI